MLALSKHNMDLLGICRPVRLTGFWFLPGLDECMPVSWVLNLYGGSKEMIGRRTASSAASVDSELVRLHRRAKVGMALVLRLRSED
jgi:hypothetical protein